MPCSGPGCELLATGKSVEGHDIQLLRKGSGASHKRKIWIIAQQHPGEHMAEWFMEGLLERLEQAATRKCASCWTTPIFT